MTVRVAEPGAVVLAYRLDQPNECDNSDGEGKTACYSHGGERQYFSHAPLDVAIRSRPGSKTLAAC
jgi:hypothetical protein